MRIRVWLSRICLLLAASLTVLAFVAPPVTAAARPPRFAATGFVSAIQAMINTNPQTFVADLIRVDLPHGQAKFGGDGLAYSRAAAMYPGAGAAEGPALGWDQACSRGFPCSDFFPDGGFPPPYPLYAEAENPTKTHSKPTVEGQQIGDVGGPVSFTLVDVEAIATDEEATSRAIISDVNLFPVDAVAPGANPSAVHIGELQTFTHLRVDEGVVVAEAQSLMTDVSLFGGALKIEKIVARSQSTATAAGTLANAPEVRVVGATIGGVPVEITSDGIKQDGVPQDQGAVATLSKGVGNLFGAGPLSLRLIDDRSDVREGTARASAVGLGVHIEVNGSGFPGGTTVVGDLILGTASSTAFAGDEQFEADDISFDEEFDFGDDFAVEEDFGATQDFAGDDFTSVLGETAEAPDPDVTEQAAAFDPDAGKTVTRFAPLEALLQGAAADRVTLLYLAWTLGMLGLALGSRLHPFRVTHVARNTGR